MITNVVAEKRALAFDPLHPRDPGLALLFGTGNESASGEQVTPSTASAEDTLFASERYLSETIAGLPLSLYRRLDPRGREQATDHWLYWRLHRRPNRWMAKYRFWRLLGNWHFYRGNMFIMLQPSTVMAPFELIPLHPDRVHVRFRKDNNDPYYEYQRPTGGAVDIPFGQMMHVAFLPGDDGFTGRSVISYQINTIGRALASSKAQAALQGNNANPGGVLKLKKKLSTDAKKRMAEDWAAAHKGAANAGRIALLDEDMDFTPTSMSNTDAQAVEILQFNAESMARIARVPQHKVGLLARSTFSNIEHQAIEAVQDAIMPICINIEDEIAFSLLLESEQETLYAKFNLEGLLRGDFLSRQQGLAIQRANGIIDGDDWAEVEDRNPFEGGDRRYVPLNWVDINAPPAAVPASAPTPPAARLLPPPREQRSLELLQRLRSAYQPLVEDSARRLLRREADGIERLFRRHAQERSISDFIASFEGYYVEFRDALLTGMTPALGAVAQTLSIEAMQMVGAEETDAAALDAFVSSYAASFASRHIGESRAGLLALVTDAAPEATLTAAEELFRAWRSDRPPVTAQRETARMSNAVVRFVWLAAGVTTLQWRRGAACPDCDGLDGGTVDIRDGFAPGLLHPPLHDGCSCQIIPGGMS